MDWENRLVPTFDELSYGLPRLEAHGLATVEGGRFAATQKALAVRADLHPDGLGHVIELMGHAIGAKRLAASREDRSLGRLAGLTESALSAAVQEHAAEVDRWAETWIPRFRRIERLGPLALPFLMLLVAVLLAIGRVTGAVRAVLDAFQTRARG